MIILLDLNYTLVANSPRHGTTPPRMELRLRDERYRQWLVELVRSHTVILISARPDRWLDVTLERIAEETAWRPDAACFAPFGWWNPPAIKEHLLQRNVFPQWGRDPKYLAIESNPRTRAMYAKFGILSLWVNKSGASLRDERRLVHELPR
jgi:hypothetical protein